MKEKVSYIGLSKKFLAGTVILGDKDECAIGIELTLSNEIKGEDSDHQDNDYGDFECEGLSNNTEYTVKIGTIGCKTKSVRAKTVVDEILAGSSL